MISIKTLFEKITFTISSETIYLNPDGSILSWSKRLEKERGFAASEVLGKNYGVLYAHDTTNTTDYSNLLNIAARKGKVTRSVIQLRKHGLAKRSKVILSRL